MVDDGTPAGPTIATRADPGAPTADGDAHAATLAPSNLSTGDHSKSNSIIPTWGTTEYVSLPDPGYQIGELIGRGGMGEVVVAQAQRIGREVAVKRIRAQKPSTDAVGLPYFTMKRLTGVTLGKRLADKAPIHPLLRAFADVCLAIQLAHTRGVVHRDLKLSNIMLGDYGEVYVLDWGVARVISD